MLCRHDSIRVKHPEYRHDSHPAFPIGAFSLLHIPSHSFRAQIKKKKKKFEIEEKKKKERSKISRTKSSTRSSLRNRAYVLIVV